MPARVVAGLALPGGACCSRRRSRASRRNPGSGSSTRAPGTLRTIASGIIYGASFAPDGSDRIVFGRATGAEPRNRRSTSTSSAAAGGALKRITSDGRSLNPVWGPRFIAYDRERLRRNDAPVYQIWLRGPSAGAARQLTSIHVRSLVSGPRRRSASPPTGSGCSPSSVGQDTSEAWTVQVPSGRARRVPGERPARSSARRSRATARGCWSSKAAWTVPPQTGTTSSPCRSRAARPRCSSRTPRSPAGTNSRRARPVGPRAGR